MSKKFALKINAKSKSFTIMEIDTDHLDKEPQENYMLFWGESLAHYLLKRYPESLVITRGPLVRFPINKSTIGYISPLTGVPHYSFVGGKSFRELWYLGLDAIIFTEPFEDIADHYIAISGHVPNIQVRFVSDDSLPEGQRSAYYYLVSKELGDDRTRGSIFTLGHGSYHGYLSSNIAVDAVYHAGRGGAGSIMKKFTRSLVLVSHNRISYDPEKLPSQVFKLLKRYGSRLSCRDAGTIIKLLSTGKDPAGKNTLPAWNAQKLGYPMADIGGSEILLATREGKTGCHWCPVSCRHYHTLEVDYSPNGKDIFLDDFEPAYSIFAMLGILASEDSKEAKINLLREVDKKIFIQIEQLGLDVIDVGTAISALYEGISKGLIPLSDVPSFLHDKEGNFGSIERTHEVLKIMESGNNMYPAIRFLGDGPQALASAYPGMQDIVFTCGKGTLGNAGHSNKLWTFLMPFSRFFGHYSGQIYKIPGNIPSETDDLSKLFSKVINEMFQREYFSILCNSLSCCAFGFVIFTKDGNGVELSNDNLLVDVLRFYGIETTRDELIRFAENFWAQSLELKLRYGWKPLRADDFPYRVYSAVSQAISHPPEKCKEMMDILIEEWKKQAKYTMIKYGYTVPW